MVKMTSNWYCSECDKVMSNWNEAGYYGPTDSEGNPAPEIEESYPFSSWVVLCKECAKKRGVTDESQ